MWRDVDPRAQERERPEPGLGRVGGYTEMESGPASDDPRDVLTRDLDLPRGSSRERVRVKDKEYRLSGDDVRVLATVGAFRVVPAGDLREPNPRTPTRPARDLERLRDLGLAQTVPYVVGRTRTTLVTLTGHGRDVLEGARRPGADSDRQAFYVGINKPRELAHDSRVYSAYIKAAERLTERGEPVRRVVLEEELKRSTSGSSRRKTESAENGVRRRRSGPMPWPDGPRSTNCRTRTGTCSSQMPVWSTTAAMDADRLRTSRSSRHTTAALTQRPRSVPGSRGTVPSVLASAA